MKFRPQRGGFDDAMKECVTLEPTKDALAKHLKCSKRLIMVEYYGYDARIGWETYAVNVCGHAEGFTDGPLEK